MVRSARAAGLVRCGSGIWPPDGQVVAAGGNAEPRFRRRGGWGAKTRARDRGHVRSGGCGRDGSTPNSLAPTCGCGARAVRPLLPVTAGCSILFVFRPRAQSRPAPGRAERNRGAARQGQGSSGSRETRGPPGSR